MKFNIERLFKQIKWDTSQYARLVLLGFGVVFGLQLFRTFTSVIDGHFSHSSFHSGNFGMMLMIGGLVFTSMIFNELTEPQSRQFYLTVPASHLEKFVSKLLITTIGFILFTTFSYWFFSVFNSMLARVIGGYSIGVFNPFKSQNIDLIQIYLVIQSVFLLGAITFRRYSFLKTGLALLTIGTGLATVWGSAFAAIFYDFFKDGDFNFSVSGENIFYNMEERMSFFGNLLYYLFWLALAPIMWAISYFKLTEKEV